MKIVYKVVSAVIALCVLPVMIFVPMFSYQVESSALALVADTKYMGDNVSIKYLIDAIRQYSAFGDGKGSEAFEKLMSPILVCVVFLGLIALFAILTAVFSIVFKKKYPACCTAIFGIFFTYMFSTAFNALVGPFVSGTTSLADFFNAWWLALVVKINFITLSGGYFYIYMLFAAVLVWAVAFALTEPKDKVKASYKEVQ